MKFSLGPYLSLSKFGKRKRQFLCCVHLLHNGLAKLGRFYVVVVQRQQTNVQNSVIARAKLLFVNVDILFFDVLLAVVGLLSSRNSATMLT